MNEEQQRKERVDVNLKIFNFLKRLYTTKNKLPLNFEKLALYF